MHLPAEIPSPLGGVLKARFFPPEIVGRQYGVYWSGEQGYGTVYPAIPDADLAWLYDNERYSTYLAGGGETHEAPPRGPTQRLTDAIVYRIAGYLGDGCETTGAAIHDFLGAASDVCDVGCGSGLLLTRLAELGYRVIGVEPSETARAIGVGRGLDLRPGTGEDLSALGSTCFDLISMIHALEHTRKPELAISNCYRHLKPGGYLWIEVPNADCAGFKLQNASWFHADVGRHMHYFSARSLRAFVERCGLETVEIRHGGYSAQFAWLDRASPFEKWSLLFHSATAAPERRYSSVTIIARKPKVSG